MAAAAYVAHRIRGRLRLRIKEKRDDSEYFEDVRRQLEDVPGIAEVKTNSATASVVLLHPQLPYSEVETQLRRLSLFEIIEGPEPSDSALSPLKVGVAKIDRVIAESTLGGADLRTLFFIAIVGLAIRQILRGEILAPALPLLWNAFDLATRSINKASE